MGARHRGKQRGGNGATGAWLMGRGGAPTGGSRSSRVGDCEKCSRLLESEDEKEGGRGLLLLLVVEVDRYHGKLGVCDFGDFCVAGCGQAFGQGGWVVKARRKGTAGWRWGGSCGLSWR